MRTRQLCTYLTNNLLNNGVLLIHELCSPVQVKVQTANRVRSNKLVVRALKNIYVRSWEYTVFFMAKLAYVSGYNDMVRRRVVVFQGVLLFCEPHFCYLMVNRFK